MAIELPALPYAENALEPHISAETISFHYGKHHQTYVTKLNELTPGTEFEGKSLEEIVKTSSGGVFNNAAQVWNHTFFWNCLSPTGGGAPSGELAEKLSSAFGSVEDFRAEFTEAAKTQFGSGWAWLGHDGSGLKVMKTLNADNPINHEAKPLLTLDVWEHAYYIDYRNARPDHIKNFLDNLVNWDFVASNMK